MTIMDGTLVEYPLFYVKSKYIDRSCWPAFPVVCFPPKNKEGLISVYGDNYTRCITSTRIQNKDPTVVDGSP